VIAEYKKGHTISDLLGHDARRRAQEAMTTMLHAKIEEIAADTDTNFTALK